MQAEYWKKISKELKFLGFNIDYYFLEKMVNRDVNYFELKKTDFNTLVKELPFIKGENIVIKYIVNNKPVHTFELIDFINKGSYNRIYRLVDVHSKKKYAYRVFTDSDDNEPYHKINNYIETFIHSFLSIYQKKFILQKMDKIQYNCILKLKLFGINPETKFINTLTEMMDGTLYDLLTKEQLPHEKKIIILLRCFYQIASLLEDLQDNFEFIHNDLKANNIFYRIKDAEKKYDTDNFHFYIADFDGSRLKINDMVIIGNTYLSPNSNFNPRKDLFLLLHSIYYTFNDDKWKESFFNKFNMDSRIIGDLNKFQKLYQYNVDIIEPLYEPKKFKEHLKILFRNVINEIDNDDVSTNRVKINYKKN